MSFNFIDSIAKQIGGDGEGAAMPAMPAMSVPNIGDFSSKAISSSTDFLNSNSIIARIAFIILVLVAFMIIFKVGVMFITWLLTPNPNPYIVYGLITGTTSATFPTNPAVSGSIPIGRSNNQSTGMEFTWSVWLNFTGAPSNGTYAHIFNKGDIDASSNPMINYNNSPGLYIYRNAYNNAATSGSITDSSPDNINLVVVMSSFDEDSPLYTMDIDNIPLNKWIHVAMRLQNNIFDVYINGTISQRTIFENTVARQNYGSINICQTMTGSSTGGFSGYLSNLRYYDHALNVFSISNIVSAGPNLTPSAMLGTNLKQTAGGNNYFDPNWYAARY